MSTANIRDLGQFPFAPNGNCPRSRRGAGITARDSGQVSHVRELLTVGHGTADRVRLGELLTGAGVALLVDVRRYPASRTNPDVHREELERWLPEYGIARSVRTVHANLAGFAAAGASAIHSALAVYYRWPVTTAHTKVDTTIETVPDAPASSRIRQIGQRCEEPASGLGKTEAVAHDTDEIGDGGGRERVTSAINAA
ncbi:DUF488 family protein [Micromonospora zamorensis]|uniref:DUF488 family protein n=1 Tax=Micromonospora zamorensis TaxID=709883 RepID=UPI00371FA977